MYTYCQFLKLLQGLLFSVVNAKNPSTMQNFLMKEKSVVVLECLFRALALWAWVLR